MYALLEQHRLAVVWLLLVGATLASWELGHGIGIDDLRIASAVVIAVAIVKVRLVFFEFMELRHAPRFMQLAADAWMAIICAVMIALYLMVPAAT